MRRFIQNFPMTFIVAEGKEIIILLGDFNLMPCVYTCIKELGLKTLIGIICLTHMFSFQSHTGAL